MSGMWNYCSTTLYKWCFNLFAASSATATASQYNLISPKYWSQLLAGELLLLLLLLLHIQSFRHGQSTDNIIAVLYSCNTTKRVSFFSTVIPSLIFLLLLHLLVAVFLPSKTAMILSFSVRMLAVCGHYIMDRLPP